MIKPADLLSRVRVAAPCAADWNAMHGTERVRFCHACECNVYNLSSMSRPEAERLVREAEGRVCVRFYRRADGTMLTQNCPVGLRRLKRVATRAVNATLSAVIGFLAGTGANACLTSLTRTASGNNNKTLRVAASIKAQHAFYVEPVEAPMMGAIAMPSQGDVLYNGRMEFELPPERSAPDLRAPRRKR